MKYTTTSLVTILLSLLSFQASYAQTPVQVVFVAGQSNGLGAKTVANTTQPGYNAADTDILFFYQTNFDSSGGVFTTLKTQKVDKKGPQGFGPEFNIARTLHANKTELGITKLAVFKYTYGNTNLDVDWEKGNTSGEQRYGRMFTNWEIAKADLISKGYAPEVIAFFWMQGENDACYPTMAAAYQANLTQFVSDVRGRLVLDAGGNTELPFILGRIYTPYEPRLPYQALVREAQENVADNLPYVAWTNNDGFTINADNVHYTNESQLTLGNLMADEFYYLSEY